MGPQQVELIVALFEHGSVSAAARHLNRSQPAVTKALKQIEAHVGTPLFLRTAYGVIPTEAGQAAMERCRKIRGDLLKLDEELRQLAGDFVGEVSVVVSPLAALKIIPTVSTRFRNRFPAVQLSIMGGHAPDAFAQLRKSTADYVIGPAPDQGQTAGLRVQELFQTPLAFVTGANSRHLKEAEADSLAKGQWVKIGPRNRRPIYYEYFESRKITPPEPIVTSDSILSVLAMVENTDLLFSFPKLPLPEILKQWNVAVVPVTDTLPMVRVALTSSKEKLQTPAALVLEDLVLEYGREISRTV